LHGLQRAEFLLKKNVDVKRMEAVQEEVNASLSMHCRFMTRECSQEPIITVRGLAASGVKRYFRPVPQLTRQAARTFVWERSFPEQLHSCLGKHKWHKWSTG